MQNSVTVNTPPKIKTLEEFKDWVEVQKYYYLTSTSCFDWVGPVDSNGVAIHNGKAVIGLMKWMLEGDTGGRMRCICKNAKCINPDHWIGVKQ